jgi:hypothetical protein
LNSRLPYSGERATDRFDRCFGTCSGTNAIELDSLGQNASLDDFDGLDHVADEASAFQHEHVNFSQTELFQRSQSHFGIELQLVRLETTLWQTTVHRHLTAFKTDFMVTTRTGLLAFVTTTGGFTQTGANTTTDTTLSVLGASGWLDCV